VWGINAFENLFHHKPLGMWLPETAVDMETLDVLAENNIEFTILAPWQTDKKDLDYTQPYKVECRNGKSIIVFFYNQDLSTRVSFDPGSTVNADIFVEKYLLPRFRFVSKNKQADQLILIASDGELYGHHQPFRDKFLAYLLDGALKTSMVKRTFPGLWIKQARPLQSIKIIENTSWSCLHGIKRWGEECGCTPNSSWKKPLRKALNLIAQEIDDLFLEQTQPYFADPWQLRHNYIDVIGRKISFGDYILQWIKKPISAEILQRLKYLLQAQVERQRMFTSCGWFFDDFDRIEPRNNVSYAAQAVWLTYLATGKDLSTIVKPYLRQVKSWRSGLRADTVFTHHLERCRSYEGLAVQ
jgi:alpha-amylase/alpha-mannosidase (GH57 family)